MKKRHPQSGWGRRGPAPPLPWFSTASSQRRIWFAVPSGLLTFPHIRQCVFFHYPCLKTDSLIYGHLGLVKVSKPEAHHRLRPLNGNSWVGLCGGVCGGVMAPSPAPGETAWMDRPAVPMPVSRAAHKGTHLAGRVASMLKKEIIFVSHVRKKVVPKCRPWMSLISDKRWNADKDGRLLAGYTLFWLQKYPVFWEMMLTVDGIFFF